MIVTRHHNDPRQNTRPLRDEPNFWRTSSAIRRITSGMNTGVRTLQPDGARPANPPVSPPAALREEGCRLAHETRERLIRDFAGSPLRLFT